MALLKQKNLPAKIFWPPMSEKKNYIPPWRENFRLPPLALAKSLKTPPPLRPWAVHMYAGNAFGNLVSGGGQVAAPALSGAGGLGNLFNSILG